MRSRDEESRGEPALLGLLRPKLSLCVRLRGDARTERSVLGLEGGRTGLLLSLARAGSVDDRLALRVGGGVRGARDALTERVGAVGVRPVVLRERLAAVVDREGRV